MKKIGTANGKILVALSNAEFSGLSGSTASNIPDDTNISLAPIQAKLDLIDAKEAELLELKNLCSQMEAKLTLIGI